MSVELGIPTLQAVGVRFPFSLRRRSPVDGRVSSMLCACVHASTADAVCSCVILPSMGGFLTGGAELTYWHVDTEQRALTPTTLQQYEQVRVLNRCNRFRSVETFPPNRSLVGACELTHVLPMTCASLGVAHQLPGSATRAIGGPCGVCTTCGKLT